MMPCINNPDLTIRESIFLEIGYARAVVKDGFKYGAIRTPDWWTEANGILCVAGGITYNLEQAALNAHPDHYLDRDQLYDLTNDKGEQTSLAENGAYADRVADLQNEMRIYMNALPGEFRELSSEPRETTPGILPGSVTSDEAVLSVPPGAMGIGRGPQRVDDFRVGHASRVNPADTTKRPQPESRADRTGWEENRYESCGGRGVPVGPSAAQCRCIHPPRRNRRSLIEKNVDPHRILARGN